MNNSQKYLNASNKIWTYITYKFEMYKWSHSLIMQRKKFASKLQWFLMKSHIGLYDVALLKSLEKLKIQKMIFCLTIAFSQYHTLYLLICIYSFMKVRMVTTTVKRQIHVSKKVSYATTNNSCTHWRTNQG